MPCSQRHRGFHEGETRGGKERICGRSRQQDTGSITGVHCAPAGTKSSSRVKRRLRTGMRVVTSPSYWVFDRAIGSSISTASSDMKSRQRLDLRSHPSLPAGAWTVEHDGGALHNCQETVGRLRGQRSCNDITLFELLTIAVRYENVPDCR